MKVSAHGHRSGRRRVGRPARLTSRPGRPIRRVRMVRATTSSAFDADGAEVAGPADQVVGEHGALQPGRVGVEVAGGNVVESGALFQVTDGEFADGVVTVEPVDVDGVTVEVGQEGVVPPVRPQPLLERIGEAGASHDQAAGHVSPSAAGAVDTSRRSAVKQQLVRERSRRRARRRPRPTRRRSRGTTRDDRGACWRRCGERRCGGRQRRADGRSEFEHRATS